MQQQNKMQTDNIKTKREKNIIIIIICEVENKLY